MAVPYPVVLVTEEIQSKDLKTLGTTRLG